MDIRLNQQIDNSPLIAFRIMFGIILLWQAAKHMIYGWVERLLVQPKFTFSFIWTEWLQPLPGKGMYWYYGAMCVLAVMVIAGFRYRLAMCGFTILWTGAYLMQKTVYNNHHYLLILICFLMFLMPANAYASADSRLKPSIKSLTMPAWCRYAMLLQIAIVYFYAAIAKLYPDWMDGTFTGILFNPKATAYTPFFRETWFHIVFAWAGFLFDLLIVPLLLYRKTRTIALIGAVIFHTFNWFSFEIGVFPLFSLTMLVFFYPPDVIRKLFFRRKPRIAGHEETPSVQGKRIIRYVLIPYFVIQILLPLRHHFIQGDVLYTEEGHRLSWRMMLKTKKGGTDFYVTELATGKKIVFDKSSLLLKGQISSMNGKPDMIWQMAQRIKKVYEKKGIGVTVHAEAWISVNNGPMHLLIDPNIDLAKAEWKHFTHNEWVLSP